MHEYKTAGITEMTRQEAALRVKTLPHPQQAWGGEKEEDRTDQE